MKDFYEVAIKLPSYRGTFIPSEELFDIIEEQGKTNAVYKSVFIYNTESKETLLGLKSYASITRSAYWIPIDIDKGNNSDEHTIRQATAAYYHLTDIGLTDDNMIIWFSGRGYHIDIHSDCFSLDPSPDYPYIIKQTMMSLLPNIDPMVYTRTSLIRCPLSLNAKSNMYKVNISKDELFSLNVEKIHEIASDYEECKKRVNALYDNIDNYYGEGELQEYLKKEVPKNPQLTGKIAEPNQIASCIFKMLQDGPVEGSRNQSLIVLSAYLRRCGIPSESAKSLLLDWNNKSLDEKDVIEKVEYVYNKGYQFSCEHQLLKKNCMTYCKHFKHKDLVIETKSFDEMYSSLKNRLTSDFSGKTLEIGKMLNLPEVEPFYPGELVTLFGPTGMNKTTLGQLFCMGYDFVADEIRPELQIDTLFLSLELADWNMTRRNIQIATGLSKNQVNKKIIEDKTGSFYKECKAKIDHIKMITIPPTIDQIERMIKETNPRVVFIDYIDLIEGEGFNEHDKIKRICHKLSSIAVNNDLIIVQISQISREYARKEILDLYAGKGSGAIENASRKVIGINGQRDSSIRTVEMFKANDGDLFQVTLEWQPSFRLLRINN